MQTRALRRLQSASVQLQRWPIDCHRWREHRRCRVPQAPLAVDWCDVYIFLRIQKHKCPDIAMKSDTYSKRQQATQR
jgi:hypothetical protein